MFLLLAAALLSPAAMGWVHNWCTSNKIVWWDGGDNAPFNHGSQVMDIPWGESWERSCGICARNALAKWKLEKENVGTTHTMCYYCKKDIQGIFLHYGPKANGALSGTAACGNAGGRAVAAEEAWVHYTAAAGLVAVAGAAGLAVAGIVVYRRRKIIEPDAGYKSALLP